MASKFLHIFEPLIAIIPKVKEPQSEISFRKKVYFTGFIFFIFVLMASTPIFRSQAGSHELFAFLRTITATTQGSQAELGIISILTSGLIMEILIGFKIIDVNFEDQKDLFLYNGL